MVAPWQVPYLWFCHLHVQNGRGRSYPFETYILQALSAIRMLASQYLHLNKTLKSF